MAPTTATRMTARTIDLRVFVFIGFPFKVDLELGRSKDAGNEPARKNPSETQPPPPF